MIKVRETEKKIKEIRKIDIRVKSERRREENNRNEKDRDQS